MHVYVHSRRARAAHCAPRTQARLQLTLRSCAARACAQARLQLMLDGGQRLPRLERLASALGLSDFEKNVVVAMIGQAIAPRSIGIMGGGGGGGGGHSPSKTMQVKPCSW